MTFACILMADGMCANCGDGSYVYRGEQPVRNDQGVEFCDVDCLVEWDERIIRDHPRRVTCAGCGSRRDEGCCCVEVAAWHVMRFLLGDGWDTPLWARPGVCVVDVGHPADTPAVWRDRRNPALAVCDRHRRQYEERVDEFGPFTWSPV